MENHLCEYGCGKEATYQFKNGKWCCNVDHRKCPDKKRKISIKLKGIIKTEEHKQKLRKPKTEEHKQKLRKPSEKKKLSWTKERKEKQKEYMLNGGSYYLNSFVNENSIKKLSNSLKNVWRNSNKYNREDYSKRTKAQCLNGHSYLMNSKPRNLEKSKINNEKTRQRLLNGDAIKMIKAIKKISKPELMLRNIVKEIYPELDFQYKIFNYAIDIALVEQKIAIEYDGYYHYEDLKSKKEKDYYIHRRERIEKEGWKFLRYTLYDKFPNFEKVKNDILKILEVIKC